MRFSGSKRRLPTSATQLNCAHTHERTAFARAIGPCDPTHERRAMNPSFVPYDAALAAAWCVCHRTSCPVTWLTNRLASQKLALLRHLAMEPVAIACAVVTFHQTSQERRAKGFRAHAMLPSSNLS